MEEKKEHDKLSIRLAMILQRLNGGEKLILADLAKEFNVSERTIRRDFERFAFLPIQSKEGEYSLASYALGAINFDQMRGFIAFCGLQELFPKLDDSALGDLLNETLHSSMLINPIGKQKISSSLFEELNIAILEKIRITFIYNDKKRNVEGYKLINHRGIWYLVGVEVGSKSPKSFVVDKISMLRQSDERFVLDSSLLEDIQSNQINFLSDECIEVVLWLDCYAKEYFFKYKLLQNQKVISYSDEELVLSTQVGYEEEILRLIQEWIPHIRILSPLSLNQKLKSRLEGYLGDLIENS